MKKILILILFVLPIFLFAQGKVGINIDPPLYDLDIRSQASNVNTLLNLASPDNSYFTRLLAGNPGFQASSLSWTTGIPFNFGMWDGSNFTQMMQLNPLRRVGINTFDPHFTLDVRGTDNTLAGGELQLGTPDETNFLRFFGGRLGDRNPFMAFHDKDTFHFVTTLPDWSTFTRRMTLLPTGNLGIGTERPEARLHISTNSLLGYPQIRLTEEGYDFARIKMENDANPGIYWDIAGRSDSIPENSILNFFFRNGTPEGTGDRMTIRGNGRVGINNTSPEAKLDITGGDWNLEAGNPGDLRIGNSTYGLKMSMATGGGGAGAARIFADGGINTLTFGTNRTRRMTINDAGNVGIGIDNPVEKLHVNGGFRVSGLSGSGDRNVMVDANGKFKIGAFGTDSDWSENTNAVYNISKLIGIGTTNPLSKLHVFGPGGQNGLVKITIPATGQFDLNARTMTMDADKIDVEGIILDDLFLQSISDGNVHMVGGGGKVGIGTTSPPIGKLTIEGPDNDGTIGGLEIRSAGNGQSMLMDGNEIDVTGSSLALHLNANSGLPVTIGSFSAANDYKLSVDGKIIAEEMRVQMSGSWPDYVFDDEYDLMPLDEVDELINEHGHLPGIPAASVIEEEGVELGEMQRKMMEKIEELTLYLIDQQKEIERLRELVEKK